MAAFSMQFLLVGCVNDLDRKAYVNWVRDYKNGLHQKETFNEVVYDVQYQPSEYVLISRNQANVSEGERKELLNDINKIQYFNLTISNVSRQDLVQSGVADIAEYQRKDYYFSYQFQDAITLEENGASLPCILYHYEKPATKDGGRTFVLGFERSNAKTEECKLVIQSDFLNSLPVKIKISKADIPKLRL